MKAMKRAQAVLAVLVCAVVAVTVTVSVGAAGTTAQKPCANTEPFCFSGQFNQSFEKLESVAMPKIATPAWLAAAQAPAPAPAVPVVTYNVAVRGAVTANVGEFEAQFNETLNSPQGWSRLGVRFEQVASGGRFTAWLSEASQMTSFSASGCDATVSCRVGSNVVINETRWLNGSDAWNAAGGSLRDYRHMVVSHETGHWLGHGHRSCSGAGRS